MNNLQNIYANCLEIYDKKGQKGVFDYVLENHPTLEWKRCEPCEIESPIWKTLCLVCGSVVE